MRSSIAGRKFSIINSNVNIDFTKIKVGRDSVTKFEDLGKCKHELEAAEFKGISLNLYKEIQFEYLEMYYENILVYIHNCKIYFKSI